MADEKKKAAHLYVTTLVGGGRVTAANVTCMDNLKLLCQEHHISLTISRNGGCGIDRTRNREAVSFLESGADAWVSIDGDVVFNARDVLKMFWTELPVLGAAYPAKAIDFEAVAKAAKAGVPVAELPAYAQRYIFNHVLGPGRVYENMENFTVAEVGELATGFLMIRREALLRFIERYKDEIQYITDYEPKGHMHNMVFACWLDPRSGRERAKRMLVEAAKDGNAEALVRAAEEYRSTLGDPLAIGRYLSEDYRFSVMWRLMGEKAYLAIDVNLTHIGSHAFVGDLRKAMDIAVRDLDGSPLGPPASPVPGLAVCPPDLAGVRTVLEGSYDVPGLEFEATPRILDIGANIGAFTVWASKRWPGAKFIAYEPHPEHVEMLAQNVSDIESFTSGASLVVQAAVIGDKWPEETTTLPLYEGAHNRGERSLYVLGEQRKDIGGVFVATVRARSLPAADVLKIDTEGCEVEILEAYPHLDGVTAVLLEWHRAEDYGHLVQWLPTRGFELVRDDTIGKWAPDRNLIFVRRAAATQAAE